MKIKALICSECGFDTENTHEMTQHLTQTGHDLTLVEADELEKGDELTLNEITGIKDGTMGNARGYGEPIAGAKDSSDQAEQNDNDPQV